MKMAEIDALSHLQVRVIVKRADQALDRYDAGTADPDAYRNVVKFKQSMEDLREALAAAAVVSAEPTKETK